MKDSLKPPGYAHVPTAIALMHFEPPKREDNLSPMGSTETFKPLHTITMVRVECTPCAPSPNFELISVATNIMRAVYDIPKGPNYREVPLHWSHIVAYAQHAYLTM